MSNPQIKRPRDGRIVTASEIHSVTFCPESYRLKRAGARLASHAKHDAHRGTVKHETVNRKVAVAHSRGTGSRCYVATHLYGLHDHRTEALRQWRDRVLLTRLSGRVFVRLYYAFSPVFVALARRIPALDRFARRVVDRVVSRVQCKQGGA
ncbi:conserved hypothetical protein (plasmid) [Thioalkalivibrio sp. K90mix]|uniref:CFI-box-CTERM domain-containing protein n=1 Tax=Thioalkalivibrio sp. (strain K90mix) TaxID=396595 RepID=UPI000195A5EA|nr:CFI-box-CTERM domain-containing protein [Thioalkalivibrio sp. K90mix]ADC73235.1 conserved hypothetical protein [Thioalkalivibrio sp. K90mix]